MKEITKEDNLTTNVPIVEMILMGENRFQGPEEGVGRALKIETFLGPKKSYSYRPLYRTI